MPFIPHTEAEVQAMLGTIGAASIDELFDEIPQSLRCGRLEQVPVGLSEMEITRLMHQRAAQDGASLNFIGAGAYEHHIPAAVWEITTRGEFYSAYTPYQAEASQGTLQVIYEFQSMICGLTGLDIANASLYDGATALGEAVLMAVRANRKSKSGKILMPTTVHPFYRETSTNLTEAQQIQQLPMAYDASTGVTNMEALQAHAGTDIAAVVIQQPNFFGQLEDVDAITDWAHAQGAMVIAVVNPVSLGLLKAPAEWGGQGADIACGEGQPMGSPLSSGGPYFGFMSCRQTFARQMPGRICGRTVDLDGKPGFTLTLQAREQHIRRSKATSNICTNQGLLATAATIHMALLGSEGLRRVASACHARMNALREQLAQVEGAELLFAPAGFHEAVIKLQTPVDAVLQRMAEQGVLGGYALSRHYPELGEALLVCVTETKTDEDLQRYAAVLADAIKAQ